MVGAEIAALAAERGVPVVVSTLFETGVGIAAALAMAAGSRMAVVGRGALDHGLATAGLLEHDLLREELVVEDGRMWLPDRPGPGGLGIELDDDAVGRYRGRDRGGGRVTRHRSAPEPDAGRAEARRRSSIGCGSYLGVLDGAWRRWPCERVPRRSTASRRRSSGSSRVLGAGRGAARPCGRPRPRRARPPLKLLDPRPRPRPRRGRCIRAGRSDAPGVVVLTSGTTARPKGVVLSERGAGRERRRLAGGPAARDGLAARPGPRARRGHRRPVAATRASRVPLRIAAPGDAAARSPPCAREPAPSHVSLVPAQLARLLDAAGDAPRRRPCAPCSSAAARSRRRS